MTDRLVQPKLRGRTILVTRSRSQASSFSQLLLDHGAEVLEIPTIEIVPRPPSEFDPFIARLHSYDWLFFTSVNAVHIFFDRALRLGVPEGNRFPRICTLGPATARAVEERGFTVELVPEIYQAEGVLEGFQRHVKGRLENLRILLPRASQAREILPQELRERGAHVDVLPVYDTVPPESSAALLPEILKTRKPDLVTFTSSSTVHNFVRLAGAHREIYELKYAAIGPIAGRTARDYGLKVVLQPERSTIPDLAAEIVAFFARKSS